MKKTFILILLAFCLVFAFTFTACNDNGENTVPGDGNSRPSETSNILIVYFSATNNTERIAGYIADATNGVTFELSPVNPYTSADLNYSDRNSRVYREYENEINNFIKNNDFTGKTIIPFATSASSGLGQSGALLAQMAGTGNWQEGMRFSSGASRSTVTEWVNTLNLIA